MLLYLLSTAALAATPLHAGEMAGTINENAYLLPKGAARLQIFAPSSYGVHDKVELRSALLGWLAGPNLTAEVSLFDSGSQALSIAPSAGAYWDGGFDAGGHATYTLGPADANRFSVQAGGTFSAGASTSTRLSASVGYDVVLSERTVVQLTAGGFMVDGDASGSLGASWTKAWETYRLQLGVVSLNGGAIEAALEVADVAVEIPPILPLPYFLMWWRF